MSAFQIAVLVFSGLVLFIHAIQHFSKHLQQVSNSWLPRFLEFSTRYTLAGFFLGAVATALIQSSTAITVMLVGFVGSGIMRFERTIPVILGANVGTAVTAQIVALKIADIGPIFLIIGWLVSLLKDPFKSSGKIIFYFGLVLFSLHLMSEYVGPLAKTEEFQAFLTLSSNPWMAILTGTVATGIIQSSSVVTGVGVLLVQQGLMPLDASIGFMLGANLGTTFTSVLAAFNLDRAAKMTAIAHVVFNIMGVLLFAPFISPFSNWLITISGDPGLAMANGHFLFNLITGLIVLPFTHSFARFIEKFCS
ncbi:MAG: Na/Pi symporter [Bdellovibrionaceae bacterium]|nr:Na/Pi symporter [Pseudobdellovibrionaceae bacterium]